MRSGSDSGLREITPAAPTGGVLLGLGVKALLLSSYTLLASTKIRTGEEEATKVRPLEKGALLRSVWGLRKARRYAAISFEGKLIRRSDGYAGGQTSSALSALAACRMLAKIAGLLQVRA